MRPPPRRRPRAPRPRRRRSARPAPARARPSRGRPSRAVFISVGSGFIAARTTISSPFETPASIPPAWFDVRRLSVAISSWASEPNLPASAKPVADLDALHGLDPHDRGGEARVETVLLGRVGTEPGRHAAARTSTTPPTVSRALRASSIRSRKLVLVDGGALDRDADRGEERLRDASHGDVDRGVARRGAFERVADVVEVVLLDACEVGVTRPRERHRLRPLPLRLALGRPRAHPPRPVLVVDVADDERERRPERLPVPKAREHLDAVGLDLLSRRAAVALLAAVQVGVDRVAVELEARREAGDDRDERRPVRLTGGGNAKRHVLEVIGPPARRPA